MRRKNNKNNIMLLGLFGLAFIAFSVCCIVVGFMVFIHAINNPELTLTQNFLWIFESKFRSVSVIGSIVSYLGIIILAHMD